MVARVIYGFRISVLFGLILTLFSSLIGVAAGAVQGYFGGWTDLLFQRFIEIWTSVPQLYLLIIVAAVIEPNFWILLGILLAFPGSRWSASCARSSCARAFEYVTAARARPVQPPHHLQAFAAQRHGGDAHLHALHLERLDHDADLARLSRLRASAGVGLARRVAGARQGQSPGAVARAHGLLRDRHHVESSSSSARPCATRSTRARPWHERHARIASHRHDHAGHPPIAPTPTTNGAWDWPRASPAPSCSPKSQAASSRARSRSLPMRATCSPTSLARACLVRLSSGAASRRLEAHLRLRPLPGAGRLRQRACPVRDRGVDRL